MNEISNNLLQERSYYSSNSTKLPDLKNNPLTPLAITIIIGLGTYILSKIHSYSVHSKFKLPSYEEISAAYLVEKKIPKGKNTPKPNVRIPIHHYTPIEFCFLLKCVSFKDFLGNLKICFHDILEKIKKQSGSNQLAPYVLVHGGCNSTLWCISLLLCEMQEALPQDVIKDSDLSKYLTSHPNIQIVFVDDAAHSGKQISHIFFTFADRLTRSLLREENEKKTIPPLINAHLYICVPYLTNSAKQRISSAISRGLKNSIEFERLTPLTQMRLKAFSKISFGKFTRVASVAEQALLFWDIFNIVSPFCVQLENGNMKEDPFIISGNSFFNKTAIVFDHKSPDSLSSYASDGADKIVGRKIPCPYNDNANHLIEYHFFKTEESRLLKGKTSLDQQYETYRLSNTKMITTNQGSFLLADTYMHGSKSKEEELHAEVEEPGVGKKHSFLMGGENGLYQLPLLEGVIVTLQNSKGSVKFEYRGNSIKILSDQRSDIHSIKTENLYT